VLLVALMAVEGEEEAPELPGLDHTSLTTVLTAGVPLLLPPLDSPEEVGGLALLEFPLTAPRAVARRLAPGVVEVPPLEVEEERLRRMTLPSPADMMTAGWRSCRPSCRAIETHTVQNPENHNIWTSYHRTHASSSFDVSALCAETSLSHEKTPPFDRK